MKTYFNKLAVFATVVASFSALPAKADDGGISVKDLKAIAGVKFNGARVVDGTLYMVGTIPAECAQGAHLDYRSDQVNGANVHVVAIHLNASCEKSDFKPASPSIPMSDILKVKYDDVSGPVRVHAMSDRDPLDASANIDPAMPANPSGELRIQSDADIAKAADDSAKAEALAAARAACAANRPDDVRADLQRAGFPDSKINDILQGMSADAQAQEIADFNTKLAQAKDEDTARLVLMAYRDFARSHNEDETALDEAYLKRRIAIISDNISGLASLSADDQDNADEAATEESSTGRRHHSKSNTSGGSEASAIKVEAQLDLLKRDMDTDKDNLGKSLLKKYRFSYADNSNTLCDLYDQLSRSEENRGQTMHAYRLLLVAKSIAPVKERINYDQDAIDLLNKGSAHCADSNSDPTKVAACVDKLEKAAAPIARRTGKTLMNRARRTKKQEDADNYNSFASVYASMFGAGPQTVYSGYGLSTPYQPGSFEQVKIQAFQQYMNPNYGMNSGANAGPTGSLF